MTRSAATDSPAADDAAVQQVGEVTRPRSPVDEPTAPLTISPDGETVEHVPLPDPLVTNICFGGPDLRTAHVTLSGTGALVSFEWPRQGLRLHHAR